MLPNDVKLGIVVVYNLIDNYVCIGYLLFQSKTLSFISSKPTFEETSFNILLVIDIPELLLNLVSCHGFMKNPNSTVTLNFRSCMIQSYLAKVLYIIEKYSKKKNIASNDVKFIINVIDQLDIDFVMVKTKQFPPYKTPSKTCIFRKIYI